MVTLGVECHDGEIARDSDGGVWGVAPVLSIRNLKCVSGPIRVQDLVFHGVGYVIKVLHRLTLPLKPTLQLHKFYPSTLTQQRLYLTNIPSPHFISPNSNILAESYCLYKKYALPVLFQILASIAKFVNVNTYANLYSLARINDIRINCRTNIFFKLRMA